MLSYASKWFVKVLPGLLLLIVALSQSPLLYAAETLFSTNVVRMMSANLNGNTQSYQPFAIRILQGLKPDIIAIQEFNYGNNSSTDLRSFVDQSFGTNFVYFRETGKSIPNGVISRYPFKSFGVWEDTLAPDREFVWAEIQLPSRESLYVVSVHLLGSSSTSRATEALMLKTNIQTRFPTNAYVVVAGDFNAGTRTEAVVTNFKTYLSDASIPTDAESGGSANTNEPRNKPYDYILPTPSLQAHQTNSMLGGRSFPNGLVFDSRVFTPLAAVSPILAGDSTNAQHMAVIKDYQFVSSSVVYYESDRPIVSVSGEAVLSWSGALTTYTVQWSSDLINWDNGVAITGNGGVFSFTNTFSPPIFFRLQLP